MAAEDAKTDFSVVQSLFGLNPDQLAYQRQQQQQQADQASAMQRAQLSPDQLMTSMQLEGGTQAGRALAPGVQGMLGMQQRPDPQMAFAKTMQSIVQGLQNEGADMSDPVKTQAEVGRRLIQAGFTGQGMQAIENARLQQQAATTASAVAAAKQATAAKDTAEAKSVAMYSNPVMAAAKEGKWDPQSLAKYMQTGDVSDLELAGNMKDKYQITDIDGKKVMVSMGGPDKGAQIVLGNVSPSKQSENASPGYRWINPDDHSKGETPILGGPEDTKRQLAQQQDAKALQSSGVQLDSVIGTANQLLKSPGLGQITGPYAGLVKMGFTGDAANSLADYKKLMANNAFEALREIRESAKTGGGLGQISDREEGMLMTAMAALDRAQTTGQFKDRLTDYITALNHAKDALKKGYEDTYIARKNDVSGGATNVPSNTPAANGPDLMNAAKAAKQRGGSPALQEWFKGLSPADQETYRKMFR